jgi:hypothetical protein
VHRKSALRASAQLPKIGICHAAKILFEAFHRSAPAFFSVRDLPEPICLDGVPRGHVYAIRNMRYRDLALRPSRKQHLKNSAVDLPVEPAYAQINPQQTRRYLERERRAPAGDDLNSGTRNE